MRWPRVIRDELAKLPWQPEHYLLSFHGIPIKYAQRGDPYATHVKRTTAELVQRLGWPRPQWTQTFQSLFGRDGWLKPYTETDAVRAGGAGHQARLRGHAGVHGGLPGDHRRDRPRVPRGVSARRRRGAAACPCLNDHPAWIEAMRTLVLEEGQGW